MASEFELIARYFERPVHHTDLGVGDDCALIRITPGHQLAISTDMLVAGTHFFADTDPAALGWKTLAVNLSDLAAMGATPRWVVLAAALPAADEAWVAAFASGFHALAARYGVDAIGGDTTRGPLNLCPTVFGEVPLGAALRRDGARDGDDIWVSGQPGRAALGLAHLQGRVRLAPQAAQICVDALTRPEPRVELGLALRGIAHAAIDVSDGLAADLGHILERSRCGAELRSDWLPAAPLLALCEDAERVMDSLLAGGDDYELCFTAAADLRVAIGAIAQQLNLPLTRIGHIRAGAPPVPVLRDAAGNELPLLRRGFDHFA
ncbi:MAG: thiamine-phosphate kinase [Rhodocyclaceae bacterium]|nr:thiamine-phosphate kinase [Rhodocyclaceae bacterium]